MLRFVSLLLGLTLLVPSAMALDKGPFYAPRIDPLAGQLRTWVVQPDEGPLVAPPPDARGELDALRALATQRTPDVERVVTYWDAGGPGYRWVQIALRHLASKPRSNPQATRALALVNVAMYDALVTAWDAKFRFVRPRPAELDPSISTLVDTPSSPSYPAEHAVAAAAAATVLGALYPEDAATFEATAREAADSRILAGVQFPSDVEAGLQLGREIGERVVAYAQQDGSDVAWEGEVPDVVGEWTGQKPVEPNAGHWRTWTLSSADELRPEPPVAYDSAEKARELAELKDMQRTFTRTQQAFFWQSFDGIFSHWYDLAHQRIFERHIDRDPLLTARIYAALAVAQYDASAACWDAKYAYWAIRPYQLDPSVNPLFPTPNHPSYPAAHGCYSGAIAATLASYFPDDAEAINGEAATAGESRLWAGIHFRSDVEAGLALGRRVASRVVASPAGAPNPSAGGVQP